MKTGSLSPAGRGKPITAAFSIVALVLFDQFTKLAIHFRGTERPIGLEAIHSTLNYHSSLLTNLNIFTSLLLLAALLLIYFWSKNTFLKYALIPIIAGGLSNTIDRLYFHASIDIINISKLSLNIADIYIAIGALLVIYEILIKPLSKPQ